MRFSLGRTGPDTWRGTRKKTWPMPVVIVAGHTGDGEHRRTGRRTTLQEQSRAVFGLLILHRGTEQCVALENIPVPPHESGQGPGAAWRPSRATGPDVEPCRVVRPSQPVLKLVRTAHYGCGTGRVRVAEVPGRAAARYPSEVWHLPVTPAPSLRDHLGVSQKAPSRTP